MPPMFTRNVTGSLWPSWTSHPTADATVRSTNNAPAAIQRALIPLEWRFDSVMIARGDYATGVERLGVRVHDRWVRDEVKVSGGAEREVIVVVMFVVVRRSYTRGGLTAADRTAGEYLGSTTGTASWSPRIAKRGKRQNFPFIARSARFSCARGLLDNARYLPARFYTYIYAVFRSTSRKWE